MNRVQPKPMSIPKFVRWLVMRQQPILFTNIMGFACISVPIRNKQTQLYTNTQTLDLRAFVSWLCILCSATVYVLTNIIPELLRYCRQCLFGDAANWTVCVNQKFKHSQTAIKTVPHWNSWLPALLTSRLYLDIFLKIPFLKKRKCKQLKENSFPDLQLFLFGKSPLWCTPTRKNSSTSKLHPSRLQTYTDSTDLGTGLDVLSSSTAVLQVVRSGL